MATNNQPERVYCPPDAKLVNQYARDVCQQLAQNEAAYNNPEVVSGLADYLNFAAQVIAKLLNDGHYELLDKRNQQG